MVWNESRAEREVQATEADRARIEERLKDKGWTKRDDSQVLIEVSKNLILGYDFNNNRRLGIIQDIQISLETLQDYKDDGLLQTPSSETGQAEWNQFKRKVRASSDRLINSMQLEELIELGGLTVPGVTARNWRYFYNGRKPIKTSLFIAFWESLDLDCCECEGLQNKPSQSLTKSSKSARLYQALLTFNYRTQVQTIAEVAAQSPRSGLFLIQGHCPVARVWLMRRLEAEMRCEYCWSEPKRLRFSFESQASPTHLEDPDQLQAAIDQWLGIPLSGALQHRNIILVLENVDALDADRLKGLMSAFSSITEQLNPNSPGFFLVFLVDYGKENSWRQDICLQSELIQVSAWRIKQHEIEQELVRVAGKLQTVLNPVQNVAQQIFEESEQGQPRLVLQQIYDQFNCQLGRAKQWQSYPSSGEE